MRKFIEWLASWFRDLPGEDGAEWEIAEPHDPQHITRIVYDDDFIQLERPAK